MINIEEIKNELNSEQLTKLNDIENRGYLNRLENKSKEEIINYLDRWTVQKQPTSLEGDIATSDTGLVSEVAEDQPQPVADTGLVSATSEEIVKTSPIDIFKKYENSNNTSLKNGYAKILKKYELKEKAIKSFNDEIKKFKKLEERELLNDFKANREQFEEFLKNQNNQN